MSSKSFFPKFWQRHEEDGVAPKPVITTEAPVNNPHTHPAEGLTGPQSNLMSYEDIYNAAGIMTPRSGYGVHKVAEMLSSSRIRDLSKEVKRASVLMALDAAGTSADDLLQDATRRQKALDNYDASQQKLLEEFEARKVGENASLQAEMDRLAAHYGERMKQNLDQVAREKETLRNWQMAKQHESQRIAEVIECCAKQVAPASVPAATATPTPPAASKASAGQ